MVIQSEAERGEEQHGDWTEQSAWVIGVGPCRSTPRRGGLAAAHEEDDVDEFDEDDFDDDFDDDFEEEFDEELDDEEELDEEELVEEEVEEEGLDEAVDDDEEEEDEDLDGEEPG